MHFVAFYGGRRYRDEAHLLAMAPSLTHRAYPCTPTQEELGEISVGVGFCFVFLFLFSENLVCESVCVCVCVCLCNLSTHINLPVH